jgi:phosphatidylglycerophosphate synthase
VTSSAHKVVIDARPRGPEGPLASKVLLGQPILRRLVDLATSIVPSGEPISIHAREEEHAALTGILQDLPHSRARLIAGPPRADAAALRTDRLYDAKRLRRAIRRGTSPESAVIWRLDQPSAIAAAEQELVRRLTYQPLGRYWAFGLAERIAARLAPTIVRPNAVTLAAAVMMCLAAGLVAFAGPGAWAFAATATALAVALVLDTADGRLARLQGTSSEFGRWLDHVLDELADLALHAAIAWSCFQSTGQVFWLLLGMLYPSGKYLFMVQSLAGEAIEPAVPSVPQLPGASSSRVEQLVRLIGHADLRWHLWIALAALGRLDVALVVYTAYFPLRTLAGAARKVVRYA